MAGQRHPVSRRRGAEAQVLRGGFFNFSRRVSPAIGGEDGTDPANYGVTLDAPIGIDLPPIPLPDPIGEIELGTLDAISIDVAIPGWANNLAATDNDWPPVILGYCSPVWTRLTGH